MLDLLHIHNARIWTGDDARPGASSITISEGLVVALDEPVPAVSGAAAVLTTVDACGKTVTPGLIDSHLHLLAGANSLNQLDLSTVKSRDEFEAAIYIHHAELPSGDWLIAFGWSQENWPGGEMPSADWLVAAADRPTVCYRMDMHAVLVNHAVLRLCDHKADPPGGRIVRDSRTGKPTGLLLESAAWQLVNSLVPEPDVPTRRQHLLRAQSQLHALGITAVGTMEYWRDVRDVFEPLRDALTLRCRITLLNRDWPLDITPAIEFRNGDTLAIIGYKAFIDGTLGSRTARMLQEYADAPGNRGLLVELAADGHLNAWVRVFAEHGLSPSIHAIVDEAVRMALDAIEALPRSIAEKSRPRIEHVQQIDQQDIWRFRRRIASMQPLHKADDCRSVRQRLGDARLGGTFAFRKLLNAGAALAFGSDWPVVSADPLLGTRVAVTGLTLDGKVFGGEENLTINEAIHAYTAGAAHALGMDDAGVLRVGALGDVAMFDHDPFEADWVHAPPRVVMTVVGGRVMYDVTGELDAASRVDAVNRHELNTEHEDAQSKIQPAACSVTTTHPH